MRYLLRSMVVATGLIALGACSTAAQDASSSSPDDSRQDVTVTLLTHDSFALSEQLIEDLKTETGITLDIVTSGDAGNLVASSILTAGSPSGDVLFGVDNTLVTRAQAAGVFEPYTSPELANVIPELQGDTASGQVTPIDYGDVCINIADDWFNENEVAPPSSLDDLIKPEYRGLLVVQDPATSSPGLAFLLATIARYPDSWQAYWESLRDNDVKVVNSWTDAYYGEFTPSGGDRPLVVSYATSPPAEIVFADDPKPKKPSTSVLTDGCYRQVEYAGLLAGTDQTQAAAQVIDWLLTEPVQSDIPLTMFVFPARANVPVPDVFSQFAAVVPEPLQLPAGEVEANLSDWLETWTAVMDR